MAFSEKPDMPEKAGPPPMYALLIRKDLRWAGHVAGLNSNHLLMPILFSQLSTECRNIGRPKPSFKDTMKGQINAKTIEMVKNRCGQIV